jgi:hypothetical protein
VLLLFGNRTNKFLGQITWRTRPEPIKISRVIGDPIIAAIITATGTVVGTVFTIRHRAKKKEAENTQDISVSKKLPAREGDHEERKQNTSSPQSKPISRLSHKEIVTAIESVPPYHQSRIQETFIGMRVTWQTRLKGVDHHADEVSVTADIPESPGIMFCKAKPEYCEGFIFAPMDTEFVVTGEIERISKYEAELRHCTFQVVKIPERQSGSSIT